MISGCLLCLGISSLAFCLVLELYCGRLLGSGVLLSVAEKREFCSGLTFLFLSVNLIASVFLVLRHDVSLDF